MSHSRKSANPARSDRLDPAEVVVEALAYFAADPTRLSRFFADTGLSPPDLRGAAARIDFPAFLIDYLASDERLLIDFALASGRDPAGLERLRHAIASPTVDEP